MKYLKSFSGLFVLVMVLLISCSTTGSNYHERANHFGITATQYEYIKKESSSGGKLDFESKLPDNQFFLIDSIAYNKRSAALYTWGQSIKQFGIRTADDAILLYEEIHSVQLRTPQRKALQSGFNKKTQ